MRSTSLRFGLSAGDVATMQSVAIRATPRHLSRAPRMLIACAAVGVAQLAGAGQLAPGSDLATIASLDEVSIEALRARSYSSVLTVLGRLEPSTPRSLLAAYGSDGLRIYTRIDVPSRPAPAHGYPVVVFMHGWSANETAAAYDFALRADDHYRRAIETFVRAGFVVLLPGWRGYGTVDGRPADGHDLLGTWNNASYVAPTFFAIDVLNLLDGLHTLAHVDWRAWGFREPGAVRIDEDRIHVAGHSQGGDVVLTMLAVAGEGSRLRTEIASGSIWAGCFVSRFTQLETYGPMETTLEAFMSGDGTWTGTATGRNGRVNPNFVFGWPSDSIETLDRASPGWTWQASTWNVPTVAEALRRSYGEMYAVLNAHVADLGDARVEVVLDDAGRAVARHDPRVAEAMERIGGFAYPQYLREPLALHYSDQDFYSTPAWNEDLSRRINAAGGRSVAHVYPGNTHNLQKSPWAWFSGPDVVPGFDRMLERDIAFFGGEKLPTVRPGGSGD